MSLRQNIEEHLVSINRSTMGGAMVLARKELSGFLLLDLVR